MVTPDQTSQLILQMVARYRVATRVTIARLLPGESEPDKRITRLVKNGLIRVHKGLPGNRSVYQLTKKGAAVAGVSEARGRIMGSQSMLKNLGVLLYCHAPDTRRHRVEAEDLGKGLGVELPDAAYCLCHVKDRIMIFECYVPGPQTPIQTVVRHLRKRLIAVKKVPALASAISDLRFGFTLIVPNAARRKAIMDAVRTCGPDERLPLIRRVRIWVEAVEELALILGAGSRSTKIPNLPTQSLFDLPEGQST